VTGIDVIRGHVDRVGNDWHRRCEIDLLPPRWGLAGEGSRCQELTRARPKVADMPASIRCSFVEANAGDCPSNIRGKISLPAPPELSGPESRDLRRCRARPDARHS